MTEYLSNLSDGTYGRELGRISPEGNMYGATRWVRDVLRNFWWNGAEWLEIGEDIGQSSSVTLLPTENQEPDTVWRCLDRMENGKYIWKYFFWDVDTQEWQPIEWYYRIDTVQALQDILAFKRGEAHEVREPDVQAMWDGYVWRRVRLSSLDDDLGITQTIASYGTTLEGLSPEVELVYISENELSLRPINSDFEYSTVNGVIVDTSKRASVFAFSPTLSWNEETETFYLSTTQPSQEYWLYLANKNDCFALATYDFRGKLFCSYTAPNNNRLGKINTDAYNAILIGRAQTNSSSKFLHELDVSLVSKASDFKETWREFSDFDLVYVDENTLQLERTYGTTGQIFITSVLYFLGESLTLDINSPIIAVDEQGNLSTTLNYVSSNLIYYVYIAANSDVYNFNEINPEENRPWHIEDEGAGDGVTGPYYDNIDFRLKMFLSTKVPEDGRLAETWQGFWARHIGQVSVDNTRKFIYSSNISAIRQATLNPSYFDGLAEIVIVDISTSQFKIAKKVGTSGIVMVGGQGVQFYDTDNVLCHSVNISDSVYSYDETEIAAPLIDTITTLNYYIESQVNIYVANNRSCWGSLAGKLFLCCQQRSSSGNLSNNFPGNQARWIASIRITTGATGNDLVLNGDFANDMDSWQGLTSWTHSPENLNAHYLYTPVLSPSVSEGELADCSEWLHIESCDVNQVTPGVYPESVILHAVSFDGGITYKVYKPAPNTLKWVSICRNNNGTWEYNNAQPGGTTWTIHTTADNTLAQALIDATNHNGSSYHWSKVNIGNMTVTDWESTGGWNTNVNTISWTTRLIDGIAETIPNTSEVYAYAPMTNNTTPAPQVASASSTYGGYAPWIPLRGGGAGSNSLWIAANNPNATGVAESLMIDLGTAKAVNKYRWQRDANNVLSGYPSHWKLQGTNNTNARADDAETANGWVELHNYNGYIGPVNYGAWTEYFQFSNFTPYRYYRFRVSACQGSSGDLGPKIGEFVLIGTTFHSVSPSFIDVAFNYSDTVPEALRQTVGTISGKTYRIGISVSGISSTQLLTLSLDNLTSSPITSDGIHWRYIIAQESTHKLRISPTSGFTGYIDNVSCKEVSQGIFSGSYITDGIVKQELSIDNSIVGPMVLWDSQKIMQVITDALGMAGVDSVWNIEKTSGIRLRLEYIDTHTVKLVPVSGSDVYIVFPDKTFRTVPAQGITLSVLGDPNIRYFVYLTNSLFYMSQTPPDNFYQSLETLGTTAIQVGDICMTSTDTMAYQWNVCSSHNESIQEWGNNSSYVYTARSFPGFVCSKRVTATPYRTGATSFNGNYHYWYKYFDIVEGTLRVPINDLLPISQQWAEGTITLSLPMTEGIGDYLLTYAEYTDCYQNVGSSYSVECFVIQRTGSLYIKRQATL